MILNVKEEGLETRLTKLMREHGLSDYFFLDQSFPFLVKWSRMGERRCAVRVSEVESVDTDGTASTTETVEEAQTNRTGENGILRLQLSNEQARKGMNLLIAKRGKDTAFLPENTDYYWQDSGSWYKKGEYDQLRWFVFNDRNLYKPKEEVAIKGYIRKITGGKLGDVEGLGDAANGISYSVKDPRNNEIAKGTTNMYAFGAFDLKFSLPDNAKLGYARGDLTTNTSVYGGGTYSH